MRVEALSEAPQHSLCPRVVDGPRCWNVTTSSYMRSVRHDSVQDVKEVLVCVMSRLCLVLVKGCTYLGMWWCFASHVMTSLDTRHRSHLPVPELAGILLSPATTAMLLLAEGWYLFDYTPDARSVCRNRVANLVMP